MTVSPAGGGKSLTRSEANPATAVKPGRAGETRTRTGRPPRKLHVYFVVFTVLFGLLVVAGFYRTFFGPVFSGTFSRPLIVHVHGALFFGWTLLLVTQASLAATKRLRLHRAVGSAGAWLIIPMLVMGTVVAAADSAHDYRAGQGDAALVFFYGELADLAMFGVLAGGAMLLRHKPEFHKRWVIMGSLGLLGAALGRIPEILAYIDLILLILVASVAGYDLASRRTLHRATVIGAAVLLALNRTEGPIGATHLWLNTAHHLLHL